MRDLIPEKEEEFFALFREYFDLERDVGKQHDCANYSLMRMEPLATLAGHPERKLRIIHIAGTKGKGSTSYFIAALLNAAGVHCGCFSSPHLDTVRERFQFDGALCSYEELLAAAKPFCAALHDAHLTPSLFEIFTVLALRIFADKGAQYAVMETGIGGRLDATNYVEDKVMTVITALSFDHTALLGNTIEAIAGEKAGILRPNTPLVLAPQYYDAATATVRERAAQLHARVLTPEHIDTSLWLDGGSAPYLRENFCTALCAVQALGLSPQRQYFTAPRLRARFERICDSPLVIIDAAHNGDSARRLTEATTQCYPGTHFVCVLGCVPGKDVVRITKALKPMDAEFILTNPDTPRGSALPQLIEAAKAAGLKIRAIQPKIAGRADLPVDTPLLFTGSFFTALIGEEIFQESGGTNFCQR
jgi:dihydrofolate synthase / folylpolyglutamate synthase